jgi:hypothetical protein
MNPYLKIKTWYENKLFLFRFKRGLRKSFIKRYGKTPSRVTKILSTIWLFWKSNWTILLPLIVASLIALFIHFDSKSTSETKQKKDHNVGIINHEITK